MDAAQALADLTEISSQIETAVLFGDGGEIAASTLADEGAARAVAAAAERLLESAGGLAELAELTQIEASTVDGSVFVVVDGGRRIAATTGPAPTVGLVFYDLKTCLRTAEPEKPKRRSKKADGQA
jgi:predicted regulator of Ras-like GTPase activity (Roadblock/LC7/MglB family)